MRLSTVPSKPRSTIARWPACVAVGFGSPYALSCGAVFEKQFVALTPRLVALIAAADLEHVKSDQPQPTHGGLIVMQHCAAHRREVLAYDARSLGERDQRGT